MEHSHQRTDTTLGLLGRRHRRSHVWWRDRLTWYGVAGVLCCGVFAPVAWYKGHRTLHFVLSGAEDPDRELPARIAIFLGSALTGYMALFVAVVGGLLLLLAVAAG